MRVALLLLTGPLLMMGASSVPPQEQEEQTRQAILSGTSVHRLRHKMSGADQLCDQKMGSHFERLANILADQTGLMVSINPDKNNNNAGTLSFRYTDLYDFDSICHRLKVNLDDL